MDADRQVEQVSQDLKRIEMIRLELERQKKLQAVFDAFRQHGLVPVPPSNDNPFLQLAKPPAAQPKTPEGVPMLPFVKG